MKLIVERLGRIRHAEIDLRPLTVFIGPNNTNKTWAAYALFGILEGLRWTDQRAPADLRRPPEIHDLVERESMRIKGRLATVLPTAKLVERLSRPDILAALPDRMRAEIRGAALNAAIGPAMLDDARVILELTREEVCRDTLAEMELTIDEESLLVNLTHEDDERYVDTVNRLNEWIAKYLHAAFVNVRCFPAERSLLATIAPQLFQFKLRLARPLVDFLYMMLGTGARPSPVRANTPIGGNAETLLERLVGGRYAFSNTAQWLEFVPTGGDSSLPLSVGASMVKSFSGLWSYLRNEAGAGDLIIIDEPEMNAHPRAQAQTAELLAILVSQGISVVVTTHSPYLVDHLTSLIEGASDQLNDADRSELAKKLYLGDARAFIRSDKVAVWGFEPENEHVVVKRLLDEKERHIDWSTFSSVTDEVSNKYADVLDSETHADATAK